MFASWLCLDDKARRAATTPAGCSFPRTWYRYLSALLKVCAYASRTVHLHKLWQGLRGGADVGGYKSRKNYCVVRDTRFGSDCRLAVRPDYVPVIVRALGRITADIALAQEVYHSAATETSSASPMIEMSDRGLQVLDRT